RPGWREDQVVVDLAAAQDQPAYGVAALPGRAIVEHGLEPAAGQVLESRARLGQAQQALGREQHEGTELRVARLPPQQMEVLGRRGAVRDPDVPVRAEREEALDAGARVLGSLAFVAVRQEEGKPRGLPPLGKPGDDELIDDHLTAVREVAVLRFPEHQGLGRRGGIPVLESEADALRERAVMQLEGSPGAWKILDRRVAPPVLGIVQDEVTLAERAALGVLAGEPDRRALAHE